MVESSSVFRLYENAITHGSGAFLSNYIGGCQDYDPFLGTLNIR